MGEVSLRTGQDEINSLRTQLTYRWWLCTKKENIIKKKEFENVINSEKYALNHWKFYPYKYHVIFIPQTVL